ncbi:hypothetical protein M885DRAFT_617174 [Pelagophyceae sp. CCMP2097]|nr:hypothetical protein M885DRAFT_617174 [Pelagophyceae sp. CCMP2097]
MGPRRVVWALSFFGAVTCANICHDCDGESPWRARANDASAAAPPPRSSSLATGTRDTVPNAQTWSSLRWASYERGRFLVHDPDEALCRVALGPPQGGDGELRAAAAVAGCGGEELLLGASKWGLFFHAQPGGATVGLRTREPYSASACATFVEAPVYLINILTWQVGHLLVDVLEPLFYAMLDHGATAHVAPRQIRLEGGGEIDADSILVLDVANENERLVLEDKIAATVDADTAFSLLRRFSRRPIVTRERLDAISNEGRVCFAEAHVEVDVTATYYAAGREARTPAAGRAAQRRYDAFRAFLAEAAEAADGSATLVRPPTLVFVKRSGTRELENFDELAAAAATVAADAGLDLQVAALEELPFSKQREIFASARVLVAQYGSGAHNVIFTAFPNATLLLLPMPGWCDQAWHYARQAELSRTHVVVLCTDDSKAERRSRWSRRAADQGPWATKDVSYGVDAAGFEAALRRGVALNGVAAAPGAPVFEKMAGRAFFARAAGAHAASSGSVDGAVDGAVAYYDDCDDACPQPRHPPGTVLAWTPVAALPTPRVHVSDVRVEAYDGETAKVMIVAEVVVGEGALAPNWELCIATDFERTSAACFPDAVFSEFSTLDLVVAWGQHVDAQLWLVARGADGAASEISASETHFSVHVDGVYTGLGLITHDAAPLGEAPPSTLAPALDWRAARSCEGVQFEVLVETGPLRFHADVFRPTAVQAQVAAFCRDHALGTELCAHLARKTHLEALRSLRAAELGLPAVQHAPTAAAPFVFLHHEKTAGTTLRDELVATARRAGLRYFVPCWSSAGGMVNEMCYTFDVSNASAVNGGAPSDVEVVGGHFQWGVWDALPSSSQPRIFTMVRHPVERAISYYYERINQGGLVGVRPRALNDVPAADLEWIAANFRGSGFSMYRDEGLCESNCRMMLGRNDHKGRRPNEIAAGAGAPLDRALALRRLDACVVGMQEAWPQTAQTLQHWFPWLRVEDQPQRQNVGTRAETLETLRPDLRAVFEKCNVCDLELYERARIIFQKQLEVLDFPAVTTEAPAR